MTNIVVDKSADNAKPHSILLNNAKIIKYSKALYNVSMYKIKTYMIKTDRTLI